MDDQKDTKTTNEKPVKIPLDFNTALDALLKVKPKPKKKPEAKKDETKTK